MKVGGAVAAAASAGKVQPGDEGKQEMLHSRKEKEKKKL